MELPKLVEKNIRHLCQKGYQAYDQDDYQQALRLFYKAWTLLPKPQYQWQASTWVLTAIGDAYYCNGKYSRGCDALNNALACPDGNNNPFILMRLGQCHFHQQQWQEAQQHLQKALQLGGEALFATEHPRYRDWLKDST